MALSAKLVMRQGQSLVMTPQLLQAIKLLQLSNLELASFIEDELERNPLLERVEDRPDPSDDHRLDAPPVEAGTAERVEGDWASGELEVDQGALESGLGTELGNTFEAAGAGPDVNGLPDQHGLSATSWTGTAGAGADGEPSSFDSYVARALDLRDVLSEQLAVAVSSPVDRLIGHALIDGIDEAGYLTEPLDEVAARLGTPIGRGAPGVGGGAPVGPPGADGGARRLREGRARRQLAHRAERRRAAPPARQPDLPGPRHPRHGQRHRPRVRGQLPA